MFVEIKSEAFFNSAESDGNLINQKALTDDYGLVYYHGKTLKGQLKDIGFWIYKKYMNVDCLKANKFLDIFLFLFGSSKQELMERGITSSIPVNLEGAMKLSSLELDEETKSFFKDWFEFEHQKNYITLTKDELIKAQTNDRTQIKIIDGIVKSGCLMTFQTVKEGLIFESSIEIDEDSLYSEVEIFEVLVRIVSGFRKIGAGVNRGRGNIKTSLVII